MFHCDRFSDEDREGNVGGGVALYVRNNIKAKLVDKSKDGARDIPGETNQGWHHGSENLNQTFSIDSSINLKYRFRTTKLSKMKTRIFTAY